MITDNGEETTVIKSKEELVFQVGGRTFAARPVFGEANLNSDKHKFQRFWRVSAVFLAVLMVFIANYTAMLFYFSFR